MYKFLISSFFIWRISLYLLAKIGTLIIPQRIGFLGPSLWANFDGVHYLSIAQNGYMRYQEAFFPLYPLLIRVLAKSVFLGNYLWAGLFVSHLAFFIALIIFYKLVRSEFGEKKAKIAVIGMLVFPTSFFFASLYTESLFLLLILSSFYFAKQGKWFRVGIIGALASMTRLVGIFILPAILWEWWKQNNSKLKKPPNLLWLALIPLGLFLYMWYLIRLVGDPLAFIHSQPAFGAQRTGGEIILLPQVYWRYLKIFLSVSFTNYDFWIAVLEFFVFNLGLFLLWQSWKRKINLSYLIFSLLALIGPTLTGTLSSTPRYALVLFPIYFFYGLIKSQTVKYFILTTSFLLFTILTMLFTRGFFVS